MGVQIFQPLIVIYIRGNFVYHNWGYTSTYWPLSYTFTSLILMPIWLLLNLNFVIYTISCKILKNHIYREWFSFLTIKNLQGSASSRQTAVSCLSEINLSQVLKSAGSLNLTPPPKYGNPSLKNKTKSEHSNRFKFDGSSLLPSPESE